MKLRMRTWFLGIGLSLMAVSAMGCTGVATPSTEASPEATATEEATNQPVNNPALSTATPDAGTVNFDDLTASEIVAAQERHLVSLYERVVPSVVRIVTTTGAFGGGEGSGWVWDAAGHIVTNFHVVENARTINVFFADGSEYEAAVVGTDSDADLAVIKIDAANLQPAEVGDSASLKPGQTTIAIGNPFGQDFTMTTGIVSAVGRAIESGFGQFQIPAVIQTDAAINPGNSGGPLLDSSGRVIGINTQIRSQSGQSSGVGFAVPVDLVKRVVPSLIEDGSHEYSYLGISMWPVDGRIRTGAGLPSDLRGVYVRAVSVGTAAAIAGLVADSGNDVSPNYDGDIILSVNGEPTPATEDLIAYLAIYTSPGEDVIVEVYRGGEVVPVTLTLGSRNSVSS